MILAQPIEYVLKGYTCALLGKIGVARRLNSAVCHPTVRSLAALRVHWFPPVLSVSAVPVTTSPAQR